MDFGDYNAWKLIIQVGIILLTVLISNDIRRKIKFIRGSLLPTSVIAGMIIFILKFIPVVKDFIDSSFMEVLTYHCLGLGFVAISLKAATASSKSSTATVVDSGLITVGGYLAQGIVGLGLTLIFAVALSGGFFHAAGLLLPMGFGQGTGQALNIGNVFESMGMAHGKGFGLSIAAIGFLVACIVGVIYLNVLRREGKLKVHEGRKEIANSLNTDIYAPDEAPLNEAIDKLTIQLAFVFAVYLVTYLVILGLSTLSVNYLGSFGKNTLKPLFWGFNFLFGSLFALLLKKIIGFMRKKNIMTHTYINSYMMSRLSGFFFDVMIVAGIAAIEWDDLKGYLWPLLAVCALGAIITFMYVRFITKRVYKGYEHEAFFAIFGMLTGTASTGMILLREIDPNYETPAADNLVLQQMPAIIFGAPLLLMIPWAAENYTNGLIVLGIIVVMFIIYNAILLRKYIFKRKNQTPIEALNNELKAEE